MMQKSLFLFLVFAISMHLSASCQHVKKINETLNELSQLSEFVLQQSFDSSRFFYDANDSLIRTVYWLGNTSNEEIITRDEAGRIRAKHFAKGNSTPQLVYEKTYDAEGRLAFESFKNNAGGAFTNTYIYSSCEHPTQLLTQINDEAIDTLFFTYNGDCQKTSFRSSAKEITWHYTLKGMLSTRNEHDGLRNESRTYRYNEKGLLIEEYLQVIANDSDAYTPAYELMTSYLYNDNAQVISETLFHYVEGISNTVFHYDNKARLVKEEYHFNKYYERSNATKTWQYNQEDLLISFREKDELHKQFTRITPQENGYLMETEDRSQNGTLTRTAFLISFTRAGNLAAVSIKQ